VKAGRAAAQRFGWETVLAALAEVYPAAA
jgi:hypothetical protein